MMDVSKKDLKLDLYPLTEVVRQWLPITPRLCYHIGDACISLRFTILDSQTRHLERKKKRKRLFDIENYNGINWHLNYVAPQPDIDFTNRGFLF